MTQQDYRPAEFDDTPYTVAPSIPRQLGRAVPPVEEPHFEIKIDGQLLGTVYPMRLKGKAQFALERANGTLQIIQWMETYAGGDPAHIERVLEDLPIQEITAFMRSVSQALTDSLLLKNTSGPR